jgi:hypothetical protein
MGLVALDLLRLSNDREAPQARLGLGDNNAAFLCDELKLLLAAVRSSGFVATLSTWFSTTRH